MEMDATRGQKRMEQQGNKNEFLYRQASVLHRDTDEDSVKQLHTHPLTHAH